MRWIKELFREFSVWIVYERRLGGVRRGVGGAFGEKNPFIQDIHAVEIQNSTLKKLSMFHGACRKRYECKD